MIARTLAALAALAVLAAGAPAQDTRPTQPAVAAGRVVRLVGQDTVAAAGVRVWLHRVARDTQGPIDSTTSGPGGSFHFAFRADSSSIYLASARWLGIEYFSIPIITHGKDAGRPFTLVVSDTSAMVPIAVEARHIVIGRPSQDGSRSVADLIVLSNASNLTRTPAGADGVSWRVTLPASAGGLQLGESDFAQDAVVQRGDTLFLRAPIPPGNRQVTLTYVVPPNLARFAVPVDGAVPTVSVLSEDPALQVLGGLTRGDTTSVSGRVFTRWSGALAGGDSLTLVFPAATPPPGWLLPGMIALLGAGLAGTVMVMRRRTGARVPVATVPRRDANALLDRLARLDAAHVDGPEAVSAAEWDAYQAERARLKAELQSLLPR